MYRYIYISFFPLTTCVTHTTPQRYRTEDHWRAPNQHCRALWRCVPWYADVAWPHCQERHMEIIYPCTCDRQIYTWPWVLACVWSSCKNQTGNRTRHGGGIGLHARWRSCSPGAPPPTKRWCKRWSFQIKQIDAQRIQNSWTQTYMWQYAGCRPEFTSSDTCQWLWYWR